MKNRLTLTIIAVLSLTIFSCAKPPPEEKKTPAAPAARRPTPAITTTEAIPASRPEEPVAEAVSEEETVRPPARAPEARPETEVGDGVVRIGTLSVAAGTDNPGTAGGAAMTWDEAVAWASSLNWRGKTDWRLPTDRELKEIYENADRLGRYEPGEYWTSTLHPRVPDRAAVTVSLEHGKTRYRDKIEAHLIRLVRP